MNNLFNLPESASPMEEWRKRHGVELYPTMDGFRAITDLRKAHGKTREEALLNWADKAQVKCWKAEEIERMKANHGNES